MALLKPNSTYTMNGVTINEKIIPDGTRWKDGTKAQKAGFSAGSLYKKQQKLSGGTGKAKSVTIHNTNDLESVYDDGEQYTRATFNENMKSSRVHFYADDTGAWQNLKAGTGLCANDPSGSAEVSWHSGDGSVSNGGNMTSISIEIIMNETPEHDKKAYDNGARIAAWLLWKHNLTTKDLVTHTYWVNKTAGKTFADVDQQCTNPIPKKKWCPSYIFASSNAATALKNWKKFKALVESYLSALQGGSTTDTTQTTTNTQKPDAQASSQTLTVGMEVDFTGTNHYTSAYKTATRKTCKAGKAKITAIAAGKAHPYHLVAVSGKGSTVYGWVDAADVSVGADQTIRKGDKVKVLKAQTYTGKTFKTYYDTYDVIQVNGDRVVIGIGKTVTAALKASNLQKV